MHPTHGGHCPTHHEQAKPGFEPNLLGARGVGLCQALSTDFHVILPAPLSALSLSASLLSPRAADDAFPS